MSPVRATWACDWLSGSAEWSSTTNRCTKSLSASHCSSSAATRRLGCEPRVRVHWGLGQCGIRAGWCLTFTWNGDVGVLREGGQTQQELDHGEGVDVVYESADNIELPDAADALNGGFAQELADHLEGASGGVQSGARGIDGENTQVVVEKELMSLSGKGGGSTF